MSGLTDFEARTLADLAWCARLAGDADAAHSWAALAVQVAERAATGGAVVSANTELALANIQLDRCADALAAIERGLNFESGDDLSPSSILRLSLALCLAAQRLSEERLEGAALGVSEAAIRAEPNVGVWPADWSMVGKLFLSIKEGIQHPGDGQASSDPVAKARALGLMLPALLQPGTR
jgi:hypothetical protein